MRHWWATGKITGETRDSYRMFPGDLLFCFELSLGGFACGFLVPSPSQIPDRCAHWVYIESGVNLADEVVGHDQQFFGISA